MVTPRAEAPPTAARPPRRRWAWLVARLALGFVLLQALFFGLLVVGQSVPDQAVIDHLAQAVRDGSYGPSGLPDRMGGISDSFTECVVVGTGLGAEPGASALERAIRMPRISNCKSGAEQILRLEAGEYVEGSDYFKYWAGYTPIVRPLLATVGMDGVRVVSGMLLLAGAVLAWVGMRRTAGWPVALALLAPLGLASNLMSTPMGAFSHALALAALLAGVGSTALMAARSALAGLVMVALSAAVYVYVDLLTNPPLAWSLTVAAYALARASRERGWKGALLDSGVASIAWMFGFAATWVSRWLIALVTLGPRATIDVIRENVGFRLSGDYGSVDPGLGHAILTNVQWWWERMPTAPYVLWAALGAALVALAAALWRGHVRALALGLALMTPALLTLVWYTALSNHSQIHAFFAYRAVPGMVGVVVAAALAAALVPRAGAGATDG